MKIQEQDERCRGVDKGAATDLESDVLFHGEVARALAFGAHVAGALLLEVRAPARTDVARGKGLVFAMQPFLERARGAG